MPGLRSGWSVIDVDKVRRKSASGLAVECLVEGDWEWVPLSVMREPDSVGLGSVDAEIEIATWFAARKGWAIDEPNRGHEWDDSVERIHADVAKRVTFRNSGINQRDPDGILATFKGKPPNPVKTRTKKAGKFRKCCGTFAGDHPHEPHCIHNPNRKTR